MAAENLALVNSYSRALFESAKKAGVLPQVDEQAMVLEKLMASDAKLRAFIEAPNIARDQKETLLTRVFGKQFDPLLMNYLRLLVRRGRLDVLFPSLLAYHDLFREHQGVRRGVVTSAVALSPADRAQLEASLSRFTGKKLEMTYQVDPSVIGGIRFRSGDLLIDHSLQHGLRKLRQELLEGNLV